MSFTMMTTAFTVVMLTGEPFYSLEMTEYLDAFTVRQARRNQQSKVYCFTIPFMEQKAKQHGTHYKNINSLSKREKQKNCAQDMRNLSLRCQPCHKVIFIVVVCVSLQFFISFLCFWKKLKKRICDSENLRKCPLTSNVAWLLKFKTNILTIIYF